MQQRMLGGLNAYHIPGVVMAVRHDDLAGACNALGDTTRRANNSQAAPMDFRKF